MSSYQECGKLLWLCQNKLGTFCPKRLEPIFQVCAQPRNVGSMISNVLTSLIDTGGNTVSNLLTPKVTPSAHIHRNFFPCVSPSTWYSSRKRSQCPIWFRLFFGDTSNFHLASASYFVIFLYSQKRKACAVANGILFLKATLCRKILRTPVENWDVMSYFFPTLSHPQKPANLPRV